MSSWRDLVRSIGLRHGIRVSDEQADVILWEETAFPLSNVQQTTEAIEAFFDTEEFRVYAIKAARGDDADAIVLNGGLLQDE